MKMKDYMHTLHIHIMIIPAIFSFHITSFRYRRAESRADVTKMLFLK